MGLFSNDKKVELSKDDEFLTTKEVTQMLKISDDTLKRWENQGKIKPVFLPSNNGERKRPSDYRGKRYRLTDIQAMLRTN